MVEHVGRAFGKDAVALRIGVGAEAEIVAGAWDFERINSDCGRGRRNARRGWTR
jgi:hypothetical protein